MRAIAAEGGAPSLSLRAGVDLLARAGSHRASAPEVMRRLGSESGTSLGSETNLNQKPNKGAAVNRSGCHGSCGSGLDPSRPFVALSYVRRRFLRATLAATAPASAVAELGR